MPLYDHTCANGHVNEMFRPMAGPHPAIVVCQTCGEPAPRVFGRGTVLPDFPEHWSAAFDCIVKNRAHHRALQKQHNCHDFEGSLRDTPSYERIRREGL